MGRHRGKHVPDESKPLTPGEHGRSPSGQLLHQEIHQGLQSRRGHLTHGKRQSVLGYGELCQRTCKHGHHICGLDVAAVDGGGRALGEVGVEPGRIPEDVEDGPHRK